ncbi:ABC transporter ATP-binding protein [Rothia kristinae]|uniref:ABC transporter ATP-binding protein n=2 Tax=Rothia kristinae TaxID=37923 RepID=A0A7T4MVS4_9MICC|nr:ABC transporter ATP-binding protein [Rothia kristinae]
MLRPVAWPALGTLLLVVIADGLGSLGPAITGWGIDVGFPQLQAGNPWPLVWLTLAFAGSVGISALTIYLNVLITARISQRVLYDLRCRTFRHVQRLSLEFHEKYTSGRVISRLTSDLEAMREFLDSGLSAMASSLMSMVMMSVLVVLLDWRTALVILVAMVPMVALTLWFRRASEVRYRAQRVASARLVSRFTETMTGIRAVMAFRNQPRVRREYLEQADDYRVQNLRSVQIFGLYMPGVMLIANLTVAVVLLFGGFNVLHGTLAVGTLLSLVLYTQRIFMPIMELSNFYNTLQSAASALEKVSGLLEEQPSVAEPSDPLPPGGGAEGRGAATSGPASSRGALRFDGVEFSYSPDAERPTLERLDLVIPAGQKVALVGRTGAGKSTVAKLVARFYDPTRGEITLDGVDLRRLRDEDLRGQIVMVTQEAFLFSGTVAQNIALGRPGATRAEIEEAARSVGADEFIRALPEGYDTDLQQRGGRVSAGQRQLLSFARAFLADPAVLILDEATASLDLPSERQVQRGLDRLLGGRTALVIAHRLSTILDADRVLVVDAGRVIEDGSPSELIAAGGTFSRMNEAWEESQS